METEAGLPGKMVKIVDIEEQHDVSSDADDCIEIDPSEFAKKVNLKQTDDDVILVAAKGKIVKVEVDDQPEGLAKASYGYGGETNHKYVAAGGGGGCIDNPYKIDGDETSLLIKVEIDEDRFAIDKPSPELQAGDHSVHVVPRELVVVKREPVDSSGLQAIPDKPVGDMGVESAEEGSCDHCLEMAPKKVRIFDEEDEEDVVVV